MRCTIYLLQPFFRNGELLFVVSCYIPIVFVQGVANKKGVNINNSTLKVFTWHCFTNKWVFVQQKIWFQQAFTGADNINSFREVLVQYIQISMWFHLNPSHLWLSGARVCVFVLLSRVCQVLVTCAGVLGLSVHVVDALPHHKVFFNYM